jgi:hypothetical protein
MDVLLVIIAHIVSAVIQTIMQMAQNVFHVDHNALSAITQQAVPDANTPLYQFIASAMDSVYLVMLINVTIALLQIIAVLVKKDITL